MAHQRELADGHGGRRRMHGGAVAILGHGEVSGGAQQLREVKSSTRRKKMEGNGERRSSGHGGPSAAAMALVTGRMPGWALPLDHSYHKREQEWSRARRSQGGAELEIGAAVRALNAGDGVAERCCCCCATSARVSEGEAKR
jgi:hypothetical protein